MLYLISQNELERSLNDSLHKKWGFPLRISPVNMTKTPGNAIIKQSEHSGFEASRRIVWACLTILWTCLYKRGKKCKFFENVQNEWSLFVIRGINPEVSGLPISAILPKKELRDRCFPVNFAEFGEANVTSVNCKLSPVFSLPQTISIELKFMISKIEILN